MKNLFIYFVSTLTIFSVSLEIFAEDNASGRLQSIKDYLSSIRYSDGKSVLDSKQLEDRAKSFAETNLDVSFLESTYQYFRGLLYLEGGAQIFTMSSAIKTAVEFAQTENAGLEKLERFKQTYKYISRLEIPHQNSSLLYFPKYVFDQPTAFDLTFKIVNENIDLNSLQTNYAYIANLKNANQQFIFERSDAFEKAWGFAKEGKNIDEFKKYYQESYAKLKGTPALAKNALLAFYKAEETLRREEAKKAQQEAILKIEEVSKPLAAQTTCLNPK